MSKRYYVNDNAQSGGEHEVHCSDCGWLDLIQSKTSLGLHDGCKSAVTEARKHYSNVDGCAYCCATCHTK